MQLYKCKLSDVAKVEISSVDKKAKDGETPVRLCNFTDVYHNWAITSNIANTFMEASANSKEIAKFTIKKGQVAFTKDSETRDDIGIPTYIADDFEDVILGYHCALITPDETKLCGKYLNAFMHSTYIKRYFELNATGSGMRYTLSLDTLENIPLLLPPLEEQKRIGKIFSSLDKKIALNRTINQNLEALAKQLYDYWFVQFDFPNEEGKPYKSSGGKMVWNEKLKREIPVGWNNGIIGDLFATQAGYAFKSSEWKECGHPVLTIKNIQEDGSITFSDASFIDKYDCKLEKYSSNNGNMIFAMSGNTIGKIGIISSNISNVLINQRILIIKTNIKNIAFPYFVIKDKKIQNLVLQLGANSAQPNISEEEFRNIKICIPPKPIMNDFNQMFKDSFGKIINNRIEIEALTKQRDELLPLLMNGQVTIE